MIEVAALTIMPGVELGSKFRGIIVEILVYGDRVGEGPLEEIRKGFAAGGGSGPKS